MRRCALARGGDCHKALVAKVRSGRGSLAHQDDGLVVPELPEDVNGRRCYALMWLEVHRNVRIRPGIVGQRIPNFALACILDEVPECKLALLQVEPCIFQGILEAVNSVQGAPLLLFGSVARGRAECLCGSIARPRHSRAG